MSEINSNFSENNILQRNEKTSRRVAKISNRNPVEDIAVTIISLMVFMAFAYIAVLSVFQKCVIEPDNYADEHILFQIDNIPLNLIFIALFTAFVFIINKHIGFFAKVNMKFMEAGLFAFALILGFFWIFSVASVPAADSYNIYETATQAAQNDFSSFFDGSEFYNSDYFRGFSYYNLYPFQLGFVLFSEIVYRIFGTSSYMPIQIINVLCVAASFLAVAKITRLIFNRRSVEFIAIMMLAGCIQPILFCTFVYGNIIGMCCALWASYLLIRYFKSGKYILLLPCAALLVLSTIVKYNNMIYLVAFVVMLIVHTFRDRKWQSLAFALALCIAVTGAGNLIVKSYEKRADTEFSSGISQVMYLDMGLNDAYSAPGWYNEVTLNLFTDNNGDIEAAEKQALDDIKSRLELFTSYPGYAFYFFSSKIASQWNEPTFESIWISSTKSHSYEPNALANSIYSGITGNFLEEYFNFYMQIIYLLFAVGISVLFLKRKLNIEIVLLPLVLLGGFGYHLLFEGKSQYILTYIILLIPTAAYALNVIVNGRYTRVKEFVFRHSRKNNTTED